jgi:phage FluMu protein Com
VKILKEGDVAKTIPWYLSRKWECPRCGCVFQLEEKDEVRLWDGHQQEPSDPEQFGAADCPKCKCAVSTRDDREVYW